MKDGAYGWSGDRDGEGKALRFGKDYGFDSGEISGGGLDGNAEGEEEIRMRGEAEVAIGGAELCGGEEDGESGGASGFELIIWGVFD